MSSNDGRNDGRSHFGRFAKGRRRHSDKDSDKFRKTDQLPMMVSQCPAACPACLGTHIGLGHRLCHQRTAGHQWTPMDTNGHQWTPELLVCQKTSDKASARPGHCWPTPIIMEICTKNDLFGARRHFGNKAVCELQPKRPLFCQLQSSRVFRQILCVGERGRYSCYKSA